MLRLLLTVIFTGILLMPAAAADLEKIVIEGGARGDALNAYLLKPKINSSRPAIIALHGCGGLFNRKGELAARHRDWAERWIASGYVVVFPDSFGSRQLGSQCNVKSRPVPPRLRAQDANAAADWAAGQSFIDKSRLALLGWSNGGSSVLWALQPGTRPRLADFKIAVAFYPGCRAPLKRIPDWKPRVPLSILIGSEDNWTPPEPCRQIAQVSGVRLIEYPGAVHGFDAPNSRLRERTGVAYSKDSSGVVLVGTHTKARASAIHDVTRLLANALR